MNCEQMRAMLDAYIDGELSEADARALRDHADACERCKEELRTAELLRDALGHMDDDLAVPLEAQAAWRSAIRAEAGKRRKGRVMRYVYAAAAALVLVVGCTTALRGGHFENQVVSPDSGGARAMRAAEDVGLIASDGDDGAVQTVKSIAEDYTAWKKYAVEDFDRACETLEALAAEYSGTAASDQAEGDAAVSGAREAMYRVELPYEYMEDFLSAASLLGAELDSEVLDRANDAAVVYIQIFEQDAEK